MLQVITIPQSCCARYNASIALFALSTCQLHNHSVETEDMVGNVIEHIANDRVPISEGEVSVRNDSKIGDESSELLTVATKAFKYNWNKLGLNILTLYIVLFVLGTFSVSCRCKLISRCFGQHSCVERVCD